MKMINLRKNNFGFTLVELLIVIALLGIVASIVLPTMYAGTSSANAQLKMRTAEALKSCIITVHASLGWGSNITSNPNYETGNDALDMCVAGDVAITSGQDANFNRANVSGLSDMLQIVTGASAGSKGVYKVGASTMSLSATQPTGQLSVEYALTPNEEVCELLAKSEAYNGSCDLTSADTTGVIQHTASSGGTTTLKILRQLAV